MQAAGTVSPWLVVPAGVGLLAAWGVVSAAAARRRARRHLFREDAVDAPVASPEEEEASGELWSSWLEGWLFVAGFRGEGAVQRYLIAQGLAVVVGVTLSLLILSSTALQTGIEWLGEVPGGIGDLMVPIAYGAPWIVFFLIALLPVTRVRSRRFEIVASVERDLPMALALLATLVESGLGFDAALDRILNSMPPERPLARELQLFRSQTQAGVPRLNCYRALSRRIDVVSVSTFVSAMIHSELVGGGVAESLRRQADEVWARRRELAIQRAQSLPTKLAVPLVLCFLPGIFVYTFGPALAEFLRIAESVISGAR